MSGKTVEFSSDLKQQIAKNFGSAAKSYDQHADLQKKIAARLLASLEPWRDVIPPGPVVELGCGTGFVTEGLADLYPDREIQATDLSEEMVESCRRKLGDRNHLKFSVQDAEQPPYEEPHYSMTVSNFAAQWFKDPALTFGKWLEATKPGGLLLASFPGSESFPEWRKYCRELGLPFTGNPLPDVEEVVIKMSVGPAQVDYYEDTVTQTFESSRDFFKQLKQIGASTSKEGKSLSPRQFSMLIDHWDSSTEGKIKVSYHVVFLAVKRDFIS
ncbi:MAG TPA: methyltransferase domain-containing protein [Balneolaceae bacterium]